MTGKVLIFRYDCQCIRHESLMVRIGVAYQSVYEHWFASEFANVVLATVLDQLNLID